ncbi:DUF5110 domain-containing protein [Candidatus Sumerlaeota bacterium]|nr:DUF5110 domain-containing protein [Candidatus Sumerlaeota bacterium]
MTIISYKTASAQNCAEFIDKDIAIFYPERFKASDTLPSFALIKEPETMERLPDDFPVKVNFYKALDKNCAYIPIDDDTSLYGTGEVTGSLRRNGAARILWNTDNVGYQRFHGLRLYQSHPWVLALRQDGSAFGVIADSPYKQEIVLTEGIRFISNGPPFRVIVINKKSPEDVLKSLMELTGNMPLPPLWSLGYHQCRWSYYPDSRVKEIADTFRHKKIPCDVIWMDIHYMEGYRIFTFSDEHFPDPKKVNDYLHDKKFKSVWMIDPGVKNEEGYFVYDSGSKEDVWVKEASGKNFTGPVWPGDCVFPDFTQSKTREWWAGLYMDFMKLGVDGVWNDMNEPSVFKTSTYTMPTSNLHLGGDDLPKGAHARYHNVYGMLMARASREGILKANPDKRPFVLTRSNFLGGQRYAATWTGDNISSWEHLRMSIPMTLNLGLSGQPFNGPDIGGFKNDATPELFGHWIALGAFYPFSRGHTHQNSIDHEPWAFGEEIERVSRTALERRYRLLPYLYTLFYEASTTGMPVMRPVFFADVKNMNLREEEQVFLLGKDLLIIPKWAQSPNLPEGNWHTISLVGEDSENDAYQPEIKIRDGAIVPLTKVIQNTADYSHDSLYLLISLDDKEKAAGVLYEDEGEGYGYKKGEYLFSSYTAEKKGDSVIVRKTKSRGKMKFKDRIINIEVITGGKVFKGKGKEDQPITIRIK